MHLYGTSKDLMKTFTVFHKIFRGAIMKHECICVLILIFIVRRGIVFETKKTPHGSRTPQKIKFSIKDFFSKCDQIRNFLWIWSHLLKNSLMENFISGTVTFDCTHLYERN